TSTIPIVMVFGVNPERAGMIAGLQRPGGNVTGILSDVSPEIWGKRLELLKEALPLQGHARPQGDGMRPRRAAGDHRHPPVPRRLAWRRPHRRRHGAAAVRPSGDETTGVLPSSGGRSGGVEC